MTELRHIWRHTTGKVALVVISLWTFMALLSWVDPWGSPNAMDKVTGSYASPFTAGEGGKMHWLGTDGLGRDVLAGIVEGSGYSWKICLLALGLSIIIGFTLGLIAGYLENHRFRQNSVQLGLLAMALFIILYLTVYSLWSWPAVITFVLLLILVFPARNLRLRKWGVPLDSMLLRIIEIKESIPGLIVILFLLGITARHSWVSLSLIISIYLSIAIARFVRAETLKAKSDDYVQAARAAGLRSWNIMFYHILPNILPYILSILVFSIAGIILLESSLSFLGIGVGVDEITWGKMLASARAKPSAWWLAVFPGLAIFLLIYAFNEIGVLLTRRKN